MAHKPPNRPEQDKAGAGRGQVGDADSLASPRPPQARAEPVEGFLREFFYDPEEDGSLLPVLVSETQAEPEAPPEELLGFLSFQLAAEDYAIAIDEVHEIIRLAPITEVHAALDSVPALLASTSF